MILTEYEVGKPFPGPIPQNEGSVLEMAPDGGLVCLIQMPGLSRAEKQAFKKSFSRYGYLEAGTTPPVAIWIWNFPGPMNPVDVNFNAAIVDQKVIDNYLELENGQMKNMIMFYLLDRDILAGIKLVGLDPEAVKLFRETILRQRSMICSKHDYDRALKGIFSYNTNELYAMSVKFKK